MEKYMKAWKSGVANTAEIVIVLLILIILFCIEASFFALGFALVFYLSDIILGTTLCNFYGVVFWTLISWIIYKIRCVEEARKSE